MQWLEKLLEKTSYVKQLKRNLSYTDRQYEKLLFKYEELHKCLSLKNEDIDKLTNDVLEKNTIIKYNKTNARKIYKLTKDKDIRKLCNKILKGEK